MKGSKLLLLALTGVLTLGVIGCDQIMPQKTDENKTTQSTPETKDNRYGNMTMENYRDEFGKIYQSNISRLENYNGYGKILVDEPTKDYPGNEKYLDGLKKAYKDSEIKLQEFVNSLKNFNTDNPKLKEMNEKLIVQSEKLIAELKDRSSKLENVPQDLMQKSEVEFRKGLNDLLKVDEATKSDFDKLIQDAKKFLGINNNKTENK